MGDKVCIDQTRIAESLKVLPVNVMACHRVLVLCGNTYPERLWCIWELYTLLCFCERDQILDRLEFIALGASESDRSATSRRLKTFDTRNAHCYDPNEEARLKLVIRAGGEDRFLFKIHELAKHIESIAHSKITT